MQTYNSFSLRSRAFRESPECLQKDNGVGVTALQRRLLSSAEKKKQLLGICDHTATSPGRFSAFKNSSDGHDRCPSCLGFQHAEAALVDESCSHCGNMTIVMLRSRYLLARRGGIPLALPRSSSSGLRRATSAHGQGDLGPRTGRGPASHSEHQQMTGCRSLHRGMS